MATKRIKEITIIKNDLSLDDSFVGQDDYNDFQTTGEAIKNLVIDNTTATEIKLNNIDNKTVASELNNVKTQITNVEQTKEQILTAGDNIVIDRTNPASPIISSTGGSATGGGTVDSVDGLRSNAAPSIVDPDKDVKLTEYITTLELENLNANPALIIPNRRYIVMDQMERDALVAFIPDIDNMESVNRITTNNGTWTADRDGFVQVTLITANVVSGNNRAELSFKVNSVNYFYDSIPVTQIGQSYSATRLMSVVKGDVVQIQQSGNIAFGSCSCYFIPPKAVVPPIAARYIKQIKSIPLNGVNAECIIYNDNWVEISGRSAFGTAAPLVVSLSGAFGVTMNSNTYYVTTQQLWSATSNPGTSSTTASVYNITTTGFNIVSGATGTSALSWEVKGYAASITE